MLLVTQGGRALQRVAHVHVGARVHALWVDGTTGAATLVTESGACATATWDAAARTVAVHAVRALLPPAPRGGHITAAALQPPLLAYAAEPERSHVVFVSLSSSSSSTSSTDKCHVVLDSGDSSGPAATVVHQMRWVHDADASSGTATAAVLCAVAAPEGAEWVLRVVAVDRACRTAAVVATLAVVRGPAAVLAAPRTGGVLVLGDRTAVHVAAAADTVRWGVQHACRVAGRAWTGAECALGRARHVFACAERGGGGALHAVRLQGGARVADGGVLARAPWLASAACLVPIDGSSNISTDTLFCGGPSTSALLAAADDDNSDDKEEKEKGEETVEVLEMVEGTAPVADMVAEAGRLVLCGGRGADGHVASAAGALRYTEDACVALAPVAALWALPAPRGTTDAAGAHDALLVASLAAGGTRALRLDRGTAAPAAVAGLDTAHASVLCAALAPAHLVQVTATSVRVLGDASAAAAAPWCLPDGSPERLCVAAAAGARLVTASTRGTVRVFAVAATGAVACVAVHESSGGDGEDGSLYSCMALWGHATALIGTWDGRLLVVPLDQHQQQQFVVGTGTARVTALHVLDEDGAARVLCGLADGTVVVLASSAASEGRTLVPHATLRTGTAPVHLAPERRGRHRVLATGDAPLLLDRTGAVCARLACPARVGAACVLRARGFSAAGDGDLCVAHADGTHLRIGHAPGAAPETLVARACALGAAPRALCRDGGHPAAAAAAAAVPCYAVACAHADGTGSVRWLDARLAEHGALALEHACTAVAALGGAHYAVGTGCAVCVAAFDSAARTARVLATRDLRAPVTSLAVVRTASSASTTTICATAGHRVIMLQLVSSPHQQEQQEQEQEQEQEHQEEVWVLRIVDVATTPFLAGEGVFAGRDTLGVRDVLRGLRVYRVRAEDGTLALAAATHGTLRLTALAPAPADGGSTTHWLAATLEGDLLCLAQHAARLTVVAALHVGELVTRIVRAAPEDEEEQDKDEKEEQGEGSQADSVLGMARGAQTARLFYAATASGRVLAVLAVTARDGTLLRALETALAPAFSCVVGAPHRAWAAPRTPGAAVADAPRMVDGDLVQLAPRLAAPDAARLLRPLGDAATVSAATDFAQRLARVAQPQPPR